MRAFVSNSQLKNPTLNQADASTWMRDAIPSFLTPELYPAFEQFVSAYSEWLATKGGLSILGNATRLADVDETLPEFVELYFNQYFKYLPNKTEVSKRFLLKHARLINGSKGSDAAIKMLFKILYNEDISFRYPAENLFSASDMRWADSQVIKVTFANESFDNVFKGIEGVMIDGKTSNAQSRISSMKSYLAEGKQIYEFTLFQNTKTKFLANEQVTFSRGVIGVDYVSIVGTIVPLIKFNRIIDGGTLFSPEVYKIKNVAKPAAINDATIQIEVTKGGVDVVNIVKGGQFYQAGDPVLVYNRTLRNRNFKAMVTAVAGDGAITQIKIQDTGYPTFEKLPDGFSVVSENGVGAELSFGSSTIGIIEDVEVIESGLFFGNQVTVLDNLIIGANDARIDFTFEGQSSYPGKWEGRNSYTSDPASILQDSKVNQRLSYVIRSGVNFDDFKDVVKSSVHPAGYNLASEFLLRLNLNVQAYGGNYSKLNDTLYYNKEHIHTLFMDVVRNVSTQDPVKTYPIIKDYRNLGQDGKRALYRQVIDLDRWNEKFNQMDDTPFGPLFGDKVIYTLQDRIDNPDYWKPLLNVSQSTLVYQEKILKGSDFPANNGGLAVSVKSKQALRIYKNDVLLSASEFSFTNGKLWFTSNLVASDTIRVRVRTAWKNL